jgi:wyosine [tRNA(Phe)-imidazoG37] synthetase (radical SAM superfamily)
VTWRKINRPQSSLALATVLDGMQQCAAEFRGELATETMLGRGANDTDAAIEAAAGRGAFS